MSDKLNEPCVNTDRELWREPPGDYYASSIHVTESGGVGINVGGHVIVMPLRGWHEAAKDHAAAEERGRDELRAALKAAENDRDTWKLLCEKADAQATAATIRANKLANKRGYDIDDDAEERGRRSAETERIWKRCLYPDTHPVLLPEEAPMPRCGKPLERWGDDSWRCADGHFNSKGTLLREGLGRLVREVWVVWARDQDKPKPHHLLPWEQISEDDKEVDRRIGETLLGIRDWRIGQRIDAALAPRDSGPVCTCPSGIWSGHVDGCALHAQEDRK